MAKIVVGVDGSVASNAALRWALDEARLCGVRLEAVHAFASPEVSTTSQALHLIETDFAPFRAAGAALVDRALSEAGAAAEPVEIERSVVEWPPAAALLDAAKEADLLVVGSRGRGGFAGLLLGSVSEQCAHHAPCPVVIVRSTRPEQSPAK
jgi:nucleotide-binding universal stress UspA family protein